MATLDTPRPYAPAWRTRATLLTGKTRTLFVVSLSMSIRALAIDVA